MVVQRYVFDVFNKKSWFDMCNMCIFENKQECPITSNGLCNSHGHCAYDSKAKQSYCYCNEGWYGSACDTKDSGVTMYDGFSVQLGLLITLLVVALALTGGMIYLSLKIGEFRKQQIESHYKSLPGGENEMVETVNFR